MTTALLLSALHFLLVFSLIAILAAQAALVRPGMTTSGLRLAAQLDRGYGVAALLLVAVGFARVFYGERGPQFYLANPVFWVKLALFVTIAILSIAPTVQFIRWLRRARAQEGFVPASEQVRGARRWLLAEGVVLLLIPFVAVAMARGVGFH